MDCDNPSLVALFGITARRLENYVASIIRPIGLGFEQTGVLFMISFKDMTISEIVAKSAKDKTTISRCISSLEKKEMLKKYYDTADRRTVYISITDIGRAKIKELLTISKNIESIFKCLDSDEQETLRTLLEKILKELV